MRSKGSRSLQAIEPNTLRAFGRTNVRTYEPSGLAGATGAVNAADRPRMEPTVGEPTRHCSSNASLLSFECFSCASCQSERFQKSAGPRLRSIRHRQGQLNEGREVRAAGPPWEARSAKLWPLRSVAAVAPALR